VSKNPEEVEQLEVSNLCISKRDVDATTGVHLPPEPFNVRIGNCHGFIMAASDLVVTKRESASEASAS